MESTRAFKPRWPTRLLPSLYTTCNLAQGEQQTKNVWNNEKSIFIFSSVSDTCFARYWVKLHSSNAKGRSGEVRMKATTVKETFRLPLLPPDQGKQTLKTWFKTLNSYINYFCLLFTDHNQSFCFNWDYWKLAKEERGNIVVFIWDNWIPGLDFRYFISKAETSTEKWWDSDLHWD